MESVRPSTALKEGAEGPDLARPGPPASRVCLLRCVDESDAKALLQPKPSNVRFKSPKDTGPTFP